MIIVYFKDGTTTTLSKDYVSVVYGDRRAVKAVDVRTGTVYFDRT